MFKNSSTVVNAVRYGVKGRTAWTQFVADNGIDKSNLSETAKSLASLAFPKADTVQTVTVDGVKVRTVYGDAVQLAGYHLRTALGTADDQTATTKNLLTREGKASTLEQVTAEWQAAQS